MQKRKTILLAPRIKRIIGDTQNMVFAVMLKHNCALNHARELAAALANSAQFDISETDPVFLCWQHSGKVTQKLGEWLGKLNVEQGELVIQSVVQRCRFLLELRPATQVQDNFSL